MYSILLVDDEVSVRNMIRTSIDWESYGFTVVDDAENGLDALEIIQDKNPDVVITDIKMPYMDGISLIQELRKTHPTTTVIIFSGYDEFSYAQRAVQLDVAYYALKPLAKDDFTALLITLKQHLDEKIEKLTDRKQLEEAYGRARTSLKQQFLADLYEDRDEDDLPDTASYDIPGDRRLYMTALIEVAGGDGKMNLASVDQILSSGIPEADSSFHTILNGFNVITFFDAPDDDHDTDEAMFIRKTLHKISSIKKHISFYVKDACAIGVSRPVRRFSDLPESRRQCICALNYKHRYPDYNIYYIGDLETRDMARITSQSTDDGLAELVAEVKLGSRETVESAVAAFFEKQVGLSAEKLRTILFKVITILSNIALEYDIDITNNSEIWTALTYIVSDVNTIQNISGRMIKFCTNLNAEIEIKRKKSNKRFVEDAKKLIDLHFRDPKFSLNGISESLGVSESYFSSAFKKECGVAFITALNRTRIEHAKTLLHDKQMKVYEVATSVGFSDPNYFSFCFKKMAGVSPQSFRKKMAYET